MSKHAANEVPWRIDPGMEVFGADGAKVGVVKHVQRHHVVVEKGWLFHTDYEIPLAMVTGVDDGVHLEMTKETLQQGGWDEGPSEVRRDSGSFNDDPVDSIGLPD